MYNICMHCVEEGDWTDEDKCPKCASEGHISPWRVSQCPACNEEFHKKIDKIIDGSNIRASINNIWAELKAQQGNKQCTVEWQDLQILINYAKDILNTTSGAYGND